MGKYQFVATHGVEFSEHDDDGKLNTWASFQRNDALETPTGEKRYTFETDDPAVARRLRKVDDYGITETSRVDDEDEVVETPLVVGDPPAPDAGKAVWVDYAAAHGMPREKAQKLSVAKLSEHFHNQRPVEQDSPGQVMVPPSQPRPNAQSDDEYNA